MKPFENSFKDNKIKNIAFSQKINGHDKFLIISFWFPLLEVKIYNSIIKKEMQTLFDIFYVASLLSNRNKKSKKILRAIKDGLEIFEGNFYYLGTEACEKMLRK